MHKLIILNNKKCQLITPDPLVLGTIDRLLSFRMEGVEYTAAYRNGHWNGYTHLINKKGIFPLGLFVIVLSKLKELDIEPIIEDKRQIALLSQPLNIAARLQEIGKAPREHQERILRASLGHRKGIIRAATGSGKSLAIAMLTAALNQPTIIYVIGLDLLQQFHDLFSSIFEEEIGFIGNGRCDIRRITIATVWTIGKALGINDKELVIEDDQVKEKYDQSNQEHIVHMLKEAKVHIFDECQTITCSTIQSIYDVIDPYWIYGFSGTPYRDDNSDLLINGILGDQIIDVPASELIEKGLLVQPLIKFVSIPKQSMSKDTYHSVYKNYIVENGVRHQIILQETQSLINKKYKILVLFKQINHGKILFELFKENNIKCAILYGHDTLDKRNDIKEQLINGEIQVILASTIFDVGVDLPILNALVLAGGGRSTIRTLQRIGRVIRSHPGKKYVAVVDTFDNVKYLKKHSLRRYEIYLNENGFKVFKSSEM